MDKNTPKTSFGQWFSPINFQSFQQDVETMHYNRYTKKLTMDAFLKLMLLAQLEQSDSLYDLQTKLLDDDLQREINLDSISVSQLSRRLNSINPNIFQRLFLDLVAKIHEKTNYAKIPMPLKIIDSSTLPLNLTNHQWAEFRKSCHYKCR